MVDVRVPAGLWRESDEAAISAWFYADGDAVAEGAVIAEIMVEKTTHELPAPTSGTLYITVAAEAPVVADQVVARID
ncbi:biotin/lipoyl-containing protein [Sphingopyxis sp.]|uniref:biotin/lipoyl-containing protein n=1 Tax=Sphingopyxis sp. TaxID=1908224 RepID=UPI003BAA39CC